MSKTVEYKCNLCSEVKKSKDAIETMKAFYWESGMMPQGYVLTEKLDSCDTHICNRCIEIIKH